ncbi:MAG: hypothetical protein AB1571_04260 [Nanoarchaeota archaeon]
MDKKAQEEWITTIPSLIFIFIVLVIYILSFVGCSKEPRKISAYSAEESSLVLLNFLKTPMYDLAMSDLIIKKQNTGDIEIDKKIYEKAKEVFDNLYGNCYELSIDSDRIVSSSITRLEPEPITVTLPNFNNPITITLKPYYLALLKENEKAAKEECQVG